jgi:uncharacterized protein YfaS (alpha-2-macroglobulin family)
VRSAATWLQRQADRSTGLIGGRTDEHHVMFGHGYATLMLATVFGMEEDVRAHRALKNVLDGAVRLTESAQSSAGGWIYRPGVDDDEGSVTVTQLQALRACRMAGIVVDSRTIARAVDYLRRCQNADGGIRYKLAMVGSSRPAITAAAVVALWNAGQYDDEPFVAAAIAYGDRHLTSPASVDGHRFYAWHYWSQAQWQRGGSVWTEHQRRTSAWLLREQRADGSWHGDGVGPVYGTAIALQILRLPYAQVPVYQR